MLVTHRYEHFCLAYAQKLRTIATYFFALVGL